MSTQDNNNQNRQNNNYGFTHTPLDVNRYTSLTQQSIPPKGSSAPYPNSNSYQNPTHSNPYANPNYQNRPQQPNYQNYTPSYSQPQQRVAYDMNAPLSPMHPRVNTWNNNMGGYQPEKENTQTFALNKNHLAASNFFTNKGLKIFSFKGISPLVIILVSTIITFIFLITVGSVFVAHGLHNINVLKDSVSKADYDAACDAGNKVLCVAKLYSTDEYFFGITLLVVAFLIILAGIVYYLIKTHFSREIEETTTFQVTNKVSGETQVFNQPKNVFAASQQAAPQPTYVPLDVSPFADPNQLNQQKNNNSQTNSKYQNPF